MLSIFLRIQGDHTTTSSYFTFYYEANVDLSTPCLHLFHPTLMVQMRGGHQEAEMMDQLLDDIHLARSPLLPRFQGYKHHVIDRSNHHIH